MRLQQTILLIISVSLLGLLFVGLHPYYGFMLDADAIGYLSIAKRVANNDWARSVNGLWSPLNSWLLVPFIQNGLDAFVVAKAINCFCAGIILLQCFYICKKIFTNNFYTICVMLCLPIVLVYYTYFQIFADLLQLVFVMAYIQLIISDNYFSSYFKIIIGALLMGIAYYAKAYSLPFYFLHSIAIFIWVAKGSNILNYCNNKLKISNANLLTEKTNCNIYKPLIGIIIFLLCITPWVLQLHQKYGGLSLTGNSGKLNMSWNLLAHKEFNDSIKILIPPTYNNSVSFWEDPYPSQAKLHTPTESVSMFAKWIFRAGHTFINLVICMNEISAFAIIILLISLWYYFFKKPKLAMQLLVITALVLPLGYLSMHIETRYIWLNTFIIIALAGALITEVENSFLQKMLSIVFCISLLIYPLYNLEQLRNKGKDNFELAAELNKNNIHGKFASNQPDAGKLWVTGYLSNNQCYTIENYNFQRGELWNEMQRYGIEYYWHYAPNEINYLRIDPRELGFETVLKFGDYQIYKVSY